MNDRNAQRKARGLIRRARLRRRRQRFTIASALILLCLSVIAIGAVNYGQTKTKQAEIATRNNRSFSMPRMAPVLARAEAPKPESDLPDLINLEERFPDYREGLGRDNLGDSGEDETPPEEPDASQAKQMVILDDLRAAPPKSMFIKAVFENSEDNFSRREPRKWLSRDIKEDDPFGRKEKPKKPKKPKDPPIPEPGTGILLGLGLTAMGGMRRAEQKRLRKRPCRDAADGSTTREGSDS